MQERHFRKEISWPDGYRMAVVLTFVMPASYRAT